MFGENLSLRCRSVSLVVDVVGVTENWSVSVWEILTVGNHNFYYFWEDGQFCTYQNYWICWNLWCTKRSSGSDHLEALIWVLIRLCTRKHGCHPGKRPRAGANVHKDASVSRRERGGTTTSESSKYFQISINCLDHKYDFQEVNCSNATIVVAPMPRRAVDISASSLCFRKCSWNVKFDLFLLHIFILTCHFTPCTVP